MTSKLPPESYDPKSLQDIQQAVAAAKEILKEQHLDNGPSLAGIEEKAKDKLEDHSSAKAESITTGPEPFFDKGFYEEIIPLDRRVEHLGKFIIKASIENNQLEKIEKYLTNENYKYEKILTNQIILKEYLD